MLDLTNDLSRLIFIIRRDIFRIALIFVTLGSISTYILINGARYEGEILIEIGKVNNSPITNLNQLIREIQNLAENKRNKKEKNQALLKKIKRVNGSDTIQLTITAKTLKSLDKHKEFLTRKVIKSHHEIVSTFIKRQEQLEESLKRTQNNILQAGQGNQLGKLNLSNTLTQNIFELEKLIIKSREARAFPNTFNTNFLSRSEKGDYLISNKRPHAIRIIAALIIWIPVAIILNLILAVTIEAHRISLLEPCTEAK